MCVGAAALNWLTDLVQYNMETNYSLPDVEAFRVVVPEDPVMRVLRNFFWKTKYPNMHNSLFVGGRLLKSFHVSLIRKSEQQVAPEIWKKYASLYLARFLALNEDIRDADYAQYVASLEKSHEAGHDATRGSETDVEQHDEPRDAPSLGIAGVKFKALVWDGRVMVITVELQKEWEPEPWGLHNEVPPCVHRCAHITLGTANESIHLDESIRLVERWLASNQGAARMDRYGNIEEDKSAEREQTEDDESKGKIWAIDVSDWVGDFIPGDIRPVLASSEAGTVCADEAVASSSQDLSGCPIDTSSKQAQGPPRPVTSPHTEALPSSTPPLLSHRRRSSLHSGETVASMGPAQSSPRPSSPLHTGRPASRSPRDLRRISVGRIWQHIKDVLHL